MKAQGMTLNIHIQHHGLYLVTLEKIKVNQAQAWHTRIGQADAQTVKPIP